MRPLYTIIIAAGLIGLSATPSFADTPPAIAMAPTAVYGVLDINKAMNDSEAGIAMKKEFEGKYQEFRGMASKDVGALHATYDTIMQNKAMSPTDKSKKQQEFQAKVTAAQAKDQDRKVIFEHSLEAATNQLRQDVRRAAADIAREKGIAAVFSSDALVLAEPSMDITAVVTERVNKQVQKIAVDWTPPAKKTK